MPLFFCAKNIPVIKKNRLPKIFDNRFNFELLSVGGVKFIFRERA